MDRHVFDGGGELGARMRAMDWSQTALGPVHTWPKSLCTCVRIILTSRQPMFVWWGPELINLYNDAYKSILGGKHPECLGQPASVVWREIWAQVGPRAEQSILKGEGTYDEALLLIMERNGYPEETYYTFSYSPVPNDDGRTGGLICANTDDTLRIVNGRQLALLKVLAEGAAQARSVPEACAVVSRCLDLNPRDLPFVLMYLLDADGKKFSLVGTSGLAPDQKASPLSVAVGDRSIWPLADALRATDARLVRDLERLGDLPHGAWERPPDHAALVPIGAFGETGRPGVLVAGLNPFRLFDENYRGFLAVMSGQISASIANAEAYEAEKKRAEALAEIDRAKTAFFSNVSHEFRTPLTLMLGPLEDALASTRDPLAPAHRDLLQVVHRNGLRLLRLVNTLLDFSRIEAGRVRGRFEPTDLAAMTRDLASTFRAAVERAGLELLVDCPPLTRPVFVDPEMWEKIVLNLLSNAFKFTFEGSITIRLRETADGAQVSVTDTGTGIPEKELPRIFDRFHRVEGARARTHEGSGIGLALVQELARMHGGVVSVESAFGRGTTFTVTLRFGAAHLPWDRVGGESAQVREDVLDPSRTEPGAGRPREAARAFVEEATRWTPSAPIQAAPARGSGAARPRILVADDNADMREYVARLLGERFDVDVVDDGRAALEAAQRRRPALIVTDVMMPVLDGFGLIRELRADPATRTIPVIMLSARAGEDARIDGIEAGADDYLVKPFAARELIARVTTRLELQRLGDRLAEERAAIAELFAKTPMPVAILQGPDLVYTVANPAYAELIGGRSVVGRPLFEALPELRGQGFDDLLHEVMRTGNALVGHERPVQLHRGGQDEVVYVTFIYAPVRGENGETDSIIALVNDVTESVRARKAVDDAQKRLSAALSASDIGTYFWDIESNTVDHDHGVKRLFGFGPDAGDDIGEYTERIHPDDRAMWLAGLDRSAREGKDFRAEYRVVLPDGAERWLIDQGKVVQSSEDGRAYMTGAVVDITERKRLEERALEANRAKDEFLAMLGHELRNPLAPILTVLQLMRLRGAASRELDVLERQVGHLTRLVDDLLDVARITRGKIELRRDRMQIADAVARAIEQSSPLLEQRRHVLDVRVPRLGLDVDGDPDRLAQVFANLLTNAAEYSEPGTRIEVYGERVGDRVRVRVKDHGSGIEPEMINRVFDRFVQQAQTIDRSRGGLGLGLTIVRSIVELHEGRVSVQSRGAGQGSEFVVELPAVDGVPVDRELSGEETPARERPKGDRRILVVDDNDDAAEMLREALEALGYQVEIAHDGPSALQVAEAFRPEVALVDIGLPVMDGYELAERFRSRSGDGQVPHLVAVTGYGQEEDRRRSQAAGFERHLVKPVDITKLEGVVKAFYPS